MKTSRIVLMSSFICVISTSCVSSKYTFMFEKKFSGHSWNKGCVAIYNDQEFLYIVNTTPYSGNEIDLSVYDPKNGIFATVKLNGTTVDYAKCKSIWFDKRGTDKTAGLYYITSAEFRNALDSYRSDLDKMKSTLDGGPFGSTKGAIRLNNNIYNVNGVEDMVAYLKNLKNDVAEKMIKAGISYNEGLKAEAILKYIDDEKKIAQEERIKMERIKEARDRWENRLSVELKLGDKVCTYEKNIFGFIEDIQGDKLKVHVIGRVNSVDGYFFSGNTYKVRYDQMEVPRWFNRLEVGLCFFD